MWWGPAIAVALGASQLWLVASHPEPAPDEPDAQHKPAYASLVRPATSIAALLLVATLAVLVGTHWPPHLQPVGLVWCSAGLVLVGVDALTTWLPIRASLFTEAALLVAIGLGILRSPGQTSTRLAGVVIGALAAGGLFWLVWWLSRALGFGDVRLAAMTGALTGLESFQWWYLALLSGAIAAVVWGLAVMVWRRWRPSPLGAAFAYGPGLWLGPWLAWGWLALSG